MTPATLTTLGGLATAVLIIVDSVHSATGWTSAWFGLVLAITLTLVVEFALSDATANRPRVARAALALINGCLVFTTALGGNQVASRSAASSRTDVLAVPPHTSLSPSSAAAHAREQPFFHDWLP